MSPNYLLFVQKLVKKKYGIQKSNFICDERHGKHGWAVVQVRGEAGPGTDRQLVADLVERTGPHAAGDPVREPANAREGRAPVRPKTLGHTLKKTTRDQ